MSITARLQELNIDLPAAGSPGGIYRPAVRTGNLVYIAGQVNVRDGALTSRGKLGDGVTLEQGQEAARVCAINCLAAAIALLGTLDSVRQIVRLTGYVASAGGFNKQSQVANGASELLRDVFGEEIGVGTRLAVGVAELPGGAPVEVDVILEVDD
jgi:enamine deaminase RidA (YjgF/YER057c/UK114 family)